MSIQFQEYWTEGRAAELRQQAILDGVPEHTVDGIVSYFTKGWEPGGFLCAVIDNDMKNAFGNADIENRARMFEIVSFLYNNAPAGTWGYPGAVAAYLDKFHNAVEVES